MKLQNGLN